MRGRLPTTGKFLPWNHCIDDKRKLKFNIIVKQNRRKGQRTMQVDPVAYYSQRRHVECGQWTATYTMKYTIK